MVSLSPSPSLNPVFNVEDQELIIATQYMAAVPEGELGSGVGSFAEECDENSAALDIMFLGF